MKTTGTDEAIKLVGSMICWWSKKTQVLECVSGHSKPFVPISWDGWFFVLDILFYRRKRR